MPSPAGFQRSTHSQKYLKSSAANARTPNTSSQQDPILVILGNPPYNGYAGIAEIDEERDLTNEYRAPVSGLPAPQGQGLNDLYIRFFRIAERRILSNADGKGIVCLITNNAWLDGLSHPTMRYRYFNAFRHIFIDNLNGDASQTGKTTPDGLPDPSAFSTPQNREGIALGTAIATLVRNRDAVQPAGALHLRDLWGTGKLKQLESESRHENEPEYDPFIPVDTLGDIFALRIHTKAYVTWPRLPELIPASFPGVKTSRDSLVVDIDRSRLESRMQQYLGQDATDAEMAEIVPDAMEGSARFNPINTRRTLQEKGFRPWQILRYVYRPFDLRWLYWEPETTLLDRNRSEYTKQMIGATLWIEARQKESGDIFSRGTATQSLADNFGNSLSNFFPEVVLESAGTLLSLEFHANLTTNAEAYLSSYRRPAI